MKKVSDWLIRCEQLIAKHSTPARTRGKYKGHGDTDSLAWVAELSKEVQAYIKATAKGGAYDENMALAASLGTILTVWYANVHRAKSLDPNRPAALRRKAARRRRDWLEVIFTAVNSDEIMVKVWPEQEYNIPFGKHAKSGKFV